MPQTIMVFDFGANEEAAQQARHKFESWKQAFRLGDKAVLKFERSNSEEPAEEGAAESKPAKTSKAAKPAGKKAAKKKSGEAEAAKKSEENSDIRVLIRLSFSDHEKLSYQRWLDRIPAEEPFKSAKGETVRHSDASFARTADLFDSLD